jgi:hypothetical protein
MSLRSNDRSRIYPTVDVSRIEIIIQEAALALLDSKCSISQSLAGPRRAANFAVQRTARCHPFTTIPYQYRQRYEEPC